MAQILGGTVQATREKGRHALCIFQNEKSAGSRQPNLCNFPQEQVRLHEWSAVRNCTIFPGNFLGDQQLELCNSQRELLVGCQGHQQPKLHNSQRELPVGYWGHQQLEICNSQRELPVGFWGHWQSKLCNSQRELLVGCLVTGSRNCEIPQGNLQSNIGRFWLGKLH